MRRQLTTFGGLLCACALTGCGDAQDDRLSALKQRIEQLETELTETQATIERMKASDELMLNQIRVNEKRHRNHVDIFQRMNTFEAQQREDARIIQKVMAEFDDESQTHGRRSGKR